MVHNRWADKSLVWTLGNSRDKACLLACDGEASFFLSECREANGKVLLCRLYCWYCNAEHLSNKYPKFKICGRNITLTQWVKRLNWNFTKWKFLLLSYESVSQNVWNAWQLISENSKCLKPIHGKAIYLKTMDVSIRSYWNLTPCGDLRLRFSNLHGSCSSYDGCWHKVVSSVGSHVLNKLSQNVLCNWHNFFPTHQFNINLDQISHPEGGSGTFLRNNGTSYAQYAMQKQKIQSH